jgi:hypothetical protein
MAPCRVGELWAPRRMGLQAAAASRGITQLPVRRWPGPMQRCRCPALIKGPLAPPPPPPHTHTQPCVALKALAEQGLCWSDFRDLLPPLLQALRSRRAAAAPADIAAALGALAQLGAPYEDLGVRGPATALLGALRDKQRAAPRAALAEALWALAALGARAAEGAEELLDALRDAAGGTAAAAGGAGGLSARHLAWAVWAAGEVGAGIGSGRAVALVNALRARAGEMAADDLAAALVGASKMPRANSDAGLKRAVLRLAEAFDPSGFARPWDSDAAAEALHAMGQLGVHPRELVDAVASRATAGAAPRRLQPRQLQLIAAGLAMLRPPAECRQHLGVLVCELARRAARVAGRGAHVGAVEAIAVAWAAATADQWELSREVVRLCEHAAGVPCWGKLAQPVLAQVRGGLSKGAPAWLVPIALAGRRLPCSSRMRGAPRRRPCPPAGPSPGVAGAHVGDRHRAPPPRPRAGLRPSRPRAAALARGRARGMAR